MKNECVIKSQTSRKKTLTDESMLEAEGSK